MSVSRRQLEAAVAADIIDSKQAEHLYQFLTAQDESTPRFDFTHVLYYFGACVAIGAMTLFMNLGWETFGGWGIVAITLIYGALGLGLRRYFANKHLLIPAGICATFTVALTPLAVYGLQQALGFWPSDFDYQDYHRHIHWLWVYMELATLAVAVLMVWRYRYPFIVLPIALTLWYLSMDATALILGRVANFDLRSLVSLYSGLLMIILAIWVQWRSQAKDYSFWLYIFGVAAFWGGLTVQDSDSELAKLGYLFINLVLMMSGVVLLRRVFVVFGALGCSFYLGHLAFDLFEDSWWLPISLSLIGLLIIYLGVVWQRHEAMLSQRMRAWLPQPLQDFLRQL
ncbi:DUF2157 domain-containing protein [Shewanella waksmanii]|uniref:DUF2157 domain-containing protein n=1 Tax=Shewanella waksmanii TaxID=213783 RepID=UPI003736AAC0